MLVMYKLYGRIRLTLFFCLAEKIVRVTIKLRISYTTWETDNETYDFWKEVYANACLSKKSVI